MGDSLVVRGIISFKIFDVGERFVFLRNSEKFSKVGVEWIKGWILGDIEL